MDPTLDTLDRAFRGGASWEHPNPGFWIGVFPNNVTVQVVRSSPLLDGPWSITFGKHPNPAEIRAQGSSLEDALQNFFQQCFLFESVLVFIG